MLFTEDYEDIDIPSDWEDLITISKHSSRYSN